jgi:hypothetical protein
MRTLSPAYAEDNVRIAVMDAAQLAVADYASSIAELRRAGVDCRAELSAKSDRFAHQVRSWVTGDSAADPAFAELMDSFVCRADKHHVTDLRTAIADRGLDDTAADTAWRAYQQLDSLDDKQAFVADFQRHTAPSTGADYG